MIDDEKPEWRRRRASFKDFSFIKSKYEQQCEEGRESAPVYLNQFSINMKSMSVAREREGVCLEKEGKSCKNNKKNAAEKRTIEEKTKRIWTVEDDLFSNKSKTH